MNLRIETNDSFYRACHSTGQRSDAVNTWQDDHKPNRDPDEIEAGAAIYAAEYWRRARAIAAAALAEYAEDVAADFADFAEFNPKDVSDFLADCAEECRAWIADAKKDADRERESAKEASEEEEIGR